MGLYRLTPVKVDFDAMDEIEQNEWLKRVLREVKDSESGDTITIERRSLFDEMERNYAAKFNKTRMWTRLKPIAIDMSVRVKMTDFIDWLEREMTVYKERYDQLIDTRG
jgi:hypothetical protein